MDFPTNPAEIQKLVDDLVVELQKASAAAGTPLAKSDEGKPEGSEGGEDGGSESPPPASPASEGPPSPDASASASAPPGGDPAASAPPSAPPGGDPASGGQPGAEGPASVEEIAALYAQLPPDQLEMHAQALQMVMQQQGAGAGASPSPGAEATPPPPPPPGAGGPSAAPPGPAGGPPGGMPPPSAGGLPPDAMKSEKRIAELEQKLAKAVEALDAAKAEQQAATERVTTVLTKMVGDPMRKSVNGIEYFSRQAATKDPAPLKKSVQEMSKAEIDAALRKAVESPKLSKSDREIVNQYYLAPGSVSLEQLAKLIS